MPDEINNNDREDLAVFPDFSDWLKTINISMSREDFILRWKTIHRVFIHEDRNEISDDWIKQLIISSLENKKLIPTSLDTLRAEVRKDDVMFSGNQGTSDEELKVLSSYCLRLLIDNELYTEDSCSQNITRILSTSLNGMKTYKGSIDLINFSRIKLFEYIRTLREKEDLQEPQFNTIISPKNKSIIESINEDNTADFELCKNATIAIVNELQVKFRYANSKMQTYTAAINNENKRLAEEQEILWYVSLCWSEKFDTHYSQLSTHLQICELANALKSRSYLNVELPSIKALANKIGIVSSDIKFRDFIEEISKEYSFIIEEYKSEISELTPCLFAVKLAIDGNWFNSWTEQIGLNSNFNINSLELTEQIYRELLVIEWQA